MMQLLRTATAFLRRLLGRDPDRAHWRQEYARKQRHSERVIEELSIQGRIAGQYRREGRR